MVSLLPGRPGYLLSSYDYRGTETRKKPHRNCSCEYIFGVDIFRLGTHSYLVTHWIEGENLTGFFAYYTF